MFNYPNKNVAPSLELPTATLFVVVTQHVELTQLILSSRSSVLCIPTSSPHACSCSLSLVGATGTIMLLITSIDNQSLSKSTFQKLST